MRNNSCVIASWIDKEDNLFIKLKIHLVYLEVIINATVLISKLREWYIRNLVTKREEILK